MSRRVTTHRYMELFACIGSSCPDHCCGGWKITMSSKQAQRLTSVLSGPLQTQVREDSNKRFRIDNSGERNCIFLSDENLCTIHRDHGEKFLPSICQNYPRKYRVVSDETELIGQLSCPEVCRLVLTDSKAFEPTYISPHGEFSALEHPNNVFWQVFPKVRMIIQRILKSSKQKVPATLIHLFHFSTCIDPYYHLNCSHRDVSIIAKETKAFLSRSVQPIAIEHISMSKCYEFLHRSFSVLVQYTPKNQRFTSLIEEILQSYQVSQDGTDLDVQELLHLYLQRKSYFSSHFPDAIDQYWKNLSLYRILDHQHNCSWKELFCELIWLKAMFSILCMGHPRLTKAKLGASEQDLQDALQDVVYSFYRLQHFPDTWKKIQKTIREEPWLNQEPQQVCHLIMG